jgi:cytoskeletal protein RodZ
MKTIGQQFAEERKNKGLSIEEVAKDTKIKEEFLRAIEKGDFKSLPSSAYASGFVRNYAKYLGLPPEKSLAIYRREFDEKKNIDVLPKGFSNPKEYVPPKFRFGRTALVLIGLFLIVAGFLVFQYRAAVFNPELKIESPTQNQEVKSLKVNVKGKTDPSATLVIDNKEVPIESSGEFEKEITVFPGESVITFTVENRFGRITTVERKILVRPR